MAQTPRRRIDFVIDALPLDESFYVHYMGQGMAVAASDEAELLSIGESEFFRPSPCWWAFDFPNFPAGGAVLLAVEHGALVCEQLVVVRRKGDPPLPSTAPRQFKIKELVELAGPRITMHRKVRGGEEFFEMVALTDDARRAEYRAAVAGERPSRGRRLTDEWLASVAAMYRDGLESGQNPTNHVAAVLHAARPTAGRWVMEARRRGLLGPATPGRPGEKGPTRGKRH